MKEGYKTHFLMNQEMEEKALPEKKNQNPWIRVTFLTDLQSHFVNLNFF